MSKSTLKFATFISDIELSFYTSLASHKINHDKLSDSARSLVGLYEIRPSDSPDTSCRLLLHGDSLTSDIVPAGFFRAEGIIKNVNTIEEYRHLDKRAILTQSAQTIWDAIKDGTIYSCPSLLASFSIICFADLKKYKFTYQFAFPVIHSDPPWAIESLAPPSPFLEGDETELGDCVARLTSRETTALVDCVQTWRYQVDARQYGFFLAKKARGTRADDMYDQSSLAPETPSQDISFTWMIDSLGSYETGFFQNTPVEDQFICFADPSTYPTHPGWMLRNLLILVRTRWKLDKVQILCYRDIPARRDDARSFILKLVSNNHGPDRLLSVEGAAGSLEMPKVTGWERNSAGKVTSKIANLGEYMDPERLADQAVDLNLKLIKWRISPELDLEKIKNASCLLLGAGTLGSYVARNLLGWGVHKITFVDNGSVSFSNPVRQPLFNFKDCIGGGAKKAWRASESLKEIYPGVESKGYVISVPMAGHPITDEAITESEFNILSKLIHEHDAIFLLTDTRESRWLPTVMGKAAGKIVMNAALGFDTFVVMRHGCRGNDPSTQELGCYFCNDVVGPADSLADRTLDQQCTVTRPGLAALASALLVEIFVSILQHPQGVLAPAPISHSDERGSHPLGLVPHQIRGFLSTFQNIVIKGMNYNCCSACSENVIQAYKSEGWSFVKRALNEQGFLEELSGLTQVQRTAEMALVDLDWGEEDDASDII